MKNPSFSLFLVFAAISASSQNTDGTPPGIKQGTLARSENVTEVIPVAFRYLRQWCNTIDYVSVKLQATSNGRELSAEGRGKMFTAAQKKLLANADPGSEIYFKIKYSHLPAVKDAGTITPATVFETDLVVVAEPETAAQYPGGGEQVINYLRNALIQKQNNPWTPPQFTEGAISFTVNETGHVTQVKLTQSTTNPVLDAGLIDAAYRMPQWSPAKNAEGVPVKQEFKVKVPFRTGGC